MSGNIIYILGFIILYTGILYFPKGKNRFSLVTEMIWSYIGVLCLGGAIAFAFQMLSVPIFISTVGTGYLGIGIICWTFIRKKGKNSFHIDRTEVCGIIFLSAIFILIALKVFTANLLLNYNNPVDPAVHFKMAKEVVLDQKIDHMFFSALHNAIFIELLSPFFDQVHWYKAFILADSFQNYVNLLAFYALVLGYMRNKRQRVAAIIITLLYWMGYPLYSYIGGNFVYWGTGVTLVAYIFALLEGQYCRKYTHLYTIIGTCLGLFSLAFCYIQFVPVMVVGAMIVLLLNLKEIKLFKKVKWKQWGFLLVIIVFCLVIGIGSCYKLIFRGYNITIFQALKGEGSIYKGIINDFIFLIPIATLYTINSIKEKEFNLSILFLGGWIEYVVVFGMSVFWEKISIYYYFKNYYPLWLAFWIIAAKAILIYRKQYRNIVLAYLMPIIILFLLLFSGIEEKFVMEINESSVSSQQILGIYSYNWHLLKDQLNDEIRTKEKECLIEWVDDNLLSKGTTALCVYSVDCKGEREWFDAITGQESGRYDFGVWDDNASIYMLDDQLKQSDDEYVVVFKNSHPYRQAKEVLDQYEKVFDNKYGIVLKLKE